MKIKQMKRPLIKPYAFKFTVDWEDSPDDKFLGVIEWVILNIGSITEKKWITRGLGSNQFTVYFDNEDDAIAFKLRWM